MSTRSISAVGGLALAGALAACGSTADATAASESAQLPAPETLARRWFEDMWNRFDASVADAIAAEDLTAHVGPSTLHGRHVLHARMAQVRRMYSRSVFTIDEIVAAGDRVVVRWTQHATHTGADLGASVAGREVTVTGVHVFRVASGKIAELWVHSDDLGELAQIGLVRVPEGW